METNIIEGNKLIAEFFGFEAAENNHYLCFIDKVTDNYYPPQHMKFSYSWDWLMPVVEKIEKTPYLTEDGCDFCCSVKILDGNTLIEDNDQKEIADCYGASKIDYTYKAVVEYIEWYNKFIKFGKPTRFRDTDKHIAAINELTRTLNLHFYNSSERNDETDHCAVTRGDSTIKIWLPNPADEQYADTFVVEIYNNLNDDILYLEDDKGVSQVKSVYAAVNLLSMYLIANGESTTAS